MSTVISIASGKGGVGKSSLAVNFSIRLQEIAGSTLLVDSDLLMANAHILMGFRPELSLVDVIEKKCALSDAIQKIPGTVSILPVRSGTSVLVEKDGDPLETLVPQIRSLKESYDYVVMDAAAGAGDGVLNALSHSDHVVIVLLGQATSFVDAYALIKNAYIERRITQFSVVVNMADNKVKAQTLYDNFERTVCGFLPVSLIYTGYIPLRDAIARSSKKCKPIVQAPGEKHLIEHIDTVVHRILAAPLSTSRQTEVVASDCG